jgi:hypothetical protein
LNYRQRVGLTSVSVIMAISGCGPYSFSPSGRQAYTSIAVPLFENQSREYGIRELLTEGVINGFIQDGTLPVVNERRAEAVLRGTVLAYARQPYTYKADETVQEYRVLITIQVRLEDPVRRSVIWEETQLVQWGDFQADTESEDEGKIRAISKLTEDIVNRTVRSW